MLIFTQHGFYSIVVDGEDRTHVLVRARTAQHLQNLLIRYDYMDGHQIVHAPAADFHFRIRVKRSRWLTLAQDLAGDVRYTNFESAASNHIAIAGPRYVRLLHALGEFVRETFEGVKA